jgi:PTS system N-acetylglucosamine-specific IIC component
MFLAPVLYVFHAIMTGLSLAVSAILGIKVGFGFSAGLIDYVLSFGISTKPILIIVLGLITAVIYYFVFLFAIKKFNLQTPGRGDDMDNNLDTTNRAVVTENKPAATSSRPDLKDKSMKILAALGGQENIVDIDACVTRIRLSVKNPDKIDEKELKSLGASAIMKMPGNSVQVVVGTMADPIVSIIKSSLKPV